MNINKGLSIFSLALGVLGGLYLSYDLLDKPKGILRRLIFAFPSAIASGIVIFITTYPTLLSLSGFIKMGNFNNESILVSRSDRVWKNVVDSTTKQAGFLWASV